VIWWTSDKFHDWRVKKWVCQCCYWWFHTYSKLLIVRASPCTCDTGEHVWCLLPMSSCSTECDVICCDVICSVAYVIMLCWVWCDQCGLLWCDQFCCLCRHARLSVMSLMWSDNVICSIAYVIMLCWVWCDLFCWLYRYALLIVMWSALMCSDLLPMSSCSAKCHMIW